ncbi:hypothetical protein LCL95_00200 [Bacillus timonensis]|nr:hypothetical protein [Bacillus timonensis]
MMKLEIRNYDKYGYPALWHYDYLQTSELVGRMSCEYLVRDGLTYQVVANATEPNNLFVLYVKEIGREHAFSEESSFTSIGFEIRELKGRFEAPIVRKEEFLAHDAVLGYLHSDFVYVERDGKQLEMKLDSLELDEDRKCYVYYGEFTGEKL